MAQKQTGTHRTVLGWWDMADGRNRRSPYAMLRRYKKQLGQVALGLREQWLAEHPKKAALVTLR